jgi:Tfp pilus assembly protein PilO
MSKSLNLSSLGPKRMVQMMLGVAALILVVGAIIVFLMQSQIRDMQATVSGKESQVGSSEQVARRYEATQAAYDEIASRTQYLEASVSAKQFVPTLLQQLQALATTTHLTVTAVRPGLIAPPVAPTPTAPAGGDAPAAPADAKKAPPPPYDILDIGVDVTGTYADTAAFLYNLTRFPKIISVASVQIHPGAGIAPTVGGKPGAPVLNTNLHLTAFVFHSDANAAPVPGTTPVTTASAVGSAPPASPAAASGLATSAPPAAPVAPTAASGTHSPSDAAAHAASRALGTGQAAQARSEVGIETL